MISNLLKSYLDDFMPILSQSDLNEVVFNKEKEYFLHRPKEKVRCFNEKFTNDYLLVFCEQLAIFRNQKFTLKTPKLNTSLPYTQIRINALHPSIIASSNISINIRVPSNFKFEINAFKLSEKCLAKNITYDFLLNLVSAGKNILISGGTASGKTSFVNSLIENIPKNERVVTIEDSPELKISNEDQVNILVDKSGSGFFTYEDGLNAAMRMSPDRLLLGEIDTHNTALFLRLANTGHSGMISTLHANSVVDAFIAICQNINLNKGGKPTPKETLLDYFCTGMDYVIQIKKKGNDRIIDDVLNVKSEFKKELML
ncbi:CpaF/VirB11 family protein [Helicobacter pylori]|uniref:CpaF/VirB11 family protein n=1 Tax=Helicobacter pylori TaxID=210 RepID=UPI0030BA8037